MTESVLQEADRLINGDRAKTYGDARQEFENVAAAWSIYLGHTLTAIDYTNMMIILKVLRARHGYHRDSYVDICGYAALGERVSAEPEPVDPTKNYTLDGVTHFGTPAAQPEPVDQETIDAYLRTLGFEPLGFINVDAIYDGLYDAEDDGGVVDEELDDDPGHMWLRGEPEPYAGAYDYSDGPPVELDEPKQSIGTFFVDVTPRFTGWLNEFLQVCGLPRQWKSMRDIPVGVDVTDAEGDPWSAAEISAQEPNSLGEIYADKWGPFKEVLTPKKPEPRVWESIRDVPEGVRVLCADNDDTDYYTVADGVVLHVVPRFNQVFPWYNTFGLDSLGPFTEVLEGQSV